MEKEVGYFLRLGSVAQREEMHKIARKSGYMDTADFLRALIFTDDKNKIKKV